MRLVPGCKIKNIEFIRESELPGWGVFRCPFCGRDFAITFRSIRNSKRIFCCGCMTPEDAVGEYLLRLSDALEKNNFVITAACREIGIGYSMYQTLMTHPEFRDGIEEIRNRKKDAIEGKYMEGVLKGNGAFILSAIKSRFMADREFGPMAPDSGNKMYEIGEKIIDDSGKFETSQEFEGEDEAV
jgi:hypothetical protein